MEDWKKKYEETLRKAKEYYADVPGSREFLDNIFPEIIESEDERISKELISFFEQFANEELRGVNISDWIDWLKKQKEQKPLSTEETEMNSIAFLEQLGYTCVPPGAEQRPTNSEKPKEWSEEDEKMLRTIISDGSRCVELDSKQIAWLKSLRPQPHWKPSEEQMLALGGCLDYLLESDNEDAEIIKSLINDLKKL